MTIPDLIDGLAQTGTGEDKLARIRAWAEKHPGKDSLDCLNHFRILTNQESGLPSATVAKIQHLHDGKPLSDLLGKPPRDLQRERDKQLLEGVAEKFSEALQEKSPGVLKKPSAAAGK